jgi:hypothetical protein
MAKSRQRTVYHVTSEQGSRRWRVEAENAQRASSTHGTKPEAVQAARRYAESNRPAQVIIHKRDGTIQSERTYEDDPHPPKG